MTQSNRDPSPIPNSLAGVLILAGGQSTRMGSPKALLTLPTGQTLLDYHVQAAKALNKPILIADNGQGFKQRQNFNAKEVPLQVIADYCPPPTASKSVPAELPKNSQSIGPLGAILSALQCLTTSKIEAMPQLTSNWLAVVSCDSLITAADIWHWVHANTDTLDPIDAHSKNQSHTHVVCLTDNSSLYPLLGLYRLDIADSLKEYLDNGQRRVMRFIEPISQTVTMPDDWQSLSNLNTPKQFKQAVVLSELF